MSNFFEVADDTRKVYKSLAVLVKHIFMTR